MQLHRPALVRLFWLFWSLPSPLDFRGVVEALLTLIRLFLNQTFIVVISSSFGTVDVHELLIIVLLRFLPRAPEPWRSITPRHRRDTSKRSCQSNNCILSITFVATYLITRTVTSVATFVLYIHMLNFCFRVAQFIGSMVIQEADQRHHLICKHP
jgi:hypothetical protein